MTRIFGKRPVVTLFLFLVAAIGIILIVYGATFHAKAMLAQSLLKNTWNKILAGDLSARPWPWADTRPFARIIVPRLAIDEIVLDGGTGRTLAFGPGHIDGTGEPGRRKNCVIIGHSDTSFAFLKYLRIKDEVILYSQHGEKYGYEVAFAKEITDEDTWVLDDSDKGTLTLITCFPFDSPLPGNGRYAVRGVLK
jgi:sortase A